MTNKRSQNFYAESLAKLLGGAALRRRELGRAAVEAVASFLAGLGVAARRSSTIADGSGLSRNNRVAPRGDHHAAAPHVLPRRTGASSCAVAAVQRRGPGLSWQRRLATPPYRGNVFAKTGTLNGVSTLSGYAKARLGAGLRLLDPLQPGAQRLRRAHAAQDRIVRALVDHG